MEVTFICGFCNYTSNKIPKNSKDGSKLICPNCNAIQTFTGNMEIISK